MAQRRARRARTGTWEQGLVSSTPNDGVLSLVSLISCMYACFLPLCPIYPRRSSPFHFHIKTCEIQQHPRTRTSSPSLRSFHGFPIFGSRAHFLSFLLSFELTAGPHPPQLSRTVTSPPFFFFPTNPLPSSATAVHSSDQGVTLNRWGLPASCPHPVGRPTSSPVCPASASHNSMLTYSCTPVSTLSPDVHSPLPSCTPLPTFARTSLFAGLTPRIRAVQTTCYAFPSADRRFWGQTHVPAHALYVKPNPHSPDRRCARFVVCSLPFFFFFFRCSVYSLVSDKYKQNVINW